MSFPFNFLKNLNNNGTLVVINEKGDPQYVIVPYQTYFDLITEKSRAQKTDTSSLTEEELLANINAKFAQCNENQSPTSLEEDYFSDNKTLTQKFSVSTFQEDEKEERLYLETIDET